MYALVSRAKIQLPPGTVLRMPATWEDYCVLRDSRGDSPLPRLKYWNEEVLLMSPLPCHGREANILADIVKVLLDSDQRNYEAFTPITMEIPERGGIEPDYCFYIDHWQDAVGKDRMNWQTEPPPDLVIEIDVTSYTAVEDYFPYRVPEVWLFKNRGLAIYRLQEEGYIVQSTSRYFPDLDLATVMDQVVQKAREQGTGFALRQFRQEWSDNHPA